MGELCIIDVKVKETSTPESLIGLISNNAVQSTSAKTIGADFRTVAERKKVLLKGKRGIPRFNKPTGLVENWPTTIYAK